MNWKQRYAKDKDDPCWCGYHQVGMKEKGGKHVPNCVPDKKKKKNKKKSSMEFFAHKGVPTNDPEALAGHLISQHDYPAEGMKNLFRDFSGEFGDPRTPLSEVMSELNNFHENEVKHKDEK